MPVCQALNKIQDLTDSETSSQSFILLTAIESSKFLVSLDIVNQVFSLLHDLCKLLQAKQVDLVSCLKHYNVLKEEIKSLRNNLF